MVVPCPRVLPPGLRRGGEVPVLLRLPWGGLRRSRRRRGGGALHCGVGLVLPFHLHCVAGAVEVLEKRHRPVAVHLGLGQQLQGDLQLPAVPLGGLAAEGGQAEARVLNPRKVLLRVDLAVDITACQPVERPICGGVTGPCSPGSPPGTGSHPPPCRS